MPCMLPLMRFRCRHTKVCRILWPKQAKPRRQSAEHCLRIGMGSWCVSSSEIELKRLRVVLHGGGNLIRALVYAKTRLHGTKGLLVIFLRQIQAAFETTSTE